MDDFIWQTGEISRLEETGRKNSAVCWGSIVCAAVRLTTFLLASRFVGDQRGMQSHRDHSTPCLQSQHSQCLDCTTGCTDVHFYGLCKPLSGTAPRFKDMAYIYTESIFPGRLGGKREEEGYVSVGTCLLNFSALCLFVAGKS